jgi:transducin (beta)-like 1
MYLGFNHTAYNLRNESQLDLSPHIRTHVKRGALVDLLGKALLYLEVETHWRANAVTASCTAPFTLLEEHVCPADAKTRPLPLAERLMEALALDRADGAKTNGSTGDKRKAAEMAAAEDRNEKRVRTSSPMDNREDGPSTGACCSNSAS